MSGADTGGFRGLLQAQAGFPASDVRGLKVLGRGTPQQGAFAESAGPKPSRNANPSVAPGRAAHPPRGWGLLSPKGAGRGRRNRLGAGGAARGVHLPASEARQMCRVPSPRAPGWDRRGRTGRSPRTRLVGLPYPSDGSQFLSEEKTDLPLLWVLQAPYPRRPSLL